MNVEVNPLTILHLMLIENLVDVVYKATPVHGSIVSFYLSLFLAHRAIQNSLYTVVFVENQANI